MLFLLFFCSVVLFLVTDESSTFPLFHGVLLSLLPCLERLAFRKLVMSHNSLAKKGVEELLEKVPIFQKAGLEPERAHHLVA